MAAELNMQTHYFTANSAKQRHFSSATFAVPTITNNPKTSKTIRSAARPRRAEQKGAQAKWEKTVKTARSLSARLECAKFIVCIRFRIYVVGERCWFLLACSVTRRPDHCSAPLHLLGRRTLNRFLVCHVWLRFPPLFRFVVALHRSESTFSLTIPFSVSAFMPMCLCVCVCVCGKYTQRIL